MGVALDGLFGFLDHVQNVYKSTTLKLKCLYNVRNHLDCQLKLKLVKSLMYPHIDYCNSVYYGFLTQQKRKKLQHIQNSAYVLTVATPYRIRVREHNMEQRVKYLYLRLLNGIVNTRYPSYLFMLISSTLHQNLMDALYTAPVLINKFLDVFALPISTFIRNLYWKAVKTVNYCFCLIL